MPLVKAQRAYVKVIGGKEYGRLEDFLTPNESVPTSLENFRRNTKSVFYTNVLLFCKKIKPLTNKFKITINFPYMLK
jgi:hypothetical protein